MNQDHHYTYRITNIKLNKHYYGVRTSKNGFLPEYDLGIRYFSSGDINFRNDQKINPDDYKYKVVRVCETRDIATQLEIDLHKKFDVGVNPNFYNRSRQTSLGFSTLNVPTTQSSKDKSRVTIENRSLERQAFITANRIAGQKNISSAMRESKLAKYMLVVENRTDKDNLLIANKKKETHRRRTSEQNARTSALMVASHAARTKEQRDSATAKKLKTYLNRTQEERDITSAKKAYARKIRSHEEQAVTFDKLSKLASGSNNHSAVRINIFDSEDVIRYECHGSFYNICADNNLPLSFLKRCYLQNLPGFKKGKHRKYFEKYSQFEGWYARKVDEN